MQSRFRLVSLLAALATVLTFAGAVAGAAVLIAQDEGIYNRRDIVRDATGLQTEDALTDYIGMNAQEQEAFAREIASRMGDERMRYRASNVSSDPSGAVLASARGVFEAAGLMRCPDPPGDGMRMSFRP